MRKWLILLGSFLFAGLVVFFYFMQRNFVKLENDCFNYEFDGIVNRVVYDIKNEPIVEINGKTFDLPVNFWNFNRRIEKGDSLVKKRNTMLIILIKHGSGEVIQVK